MQIWFIGRTLASQAGKAGSTPVICFAKEMPKIQDFLIKSRVCGTFSFLSSSTCQQMDFNVPSDF